jgi:large subunit ribosomal protein L3
MANRKGILGKKLGMTQVYRENGEIVPVTVIQAGPCYVTQIRTVAKDGYSAVQIGFWPTKRLSKPERGHLGSLPALRHLQEIRTDDTDQFQVGQLIDASVFVPGDMVDVTGTSKGRGFAGAVKRHGFKGGPKTHGQSDRHRAVGAISSGTTPGRVFKGLRAPGHMGDQRVTVLNLEVVQVDPERNLLAIRGAVPGANKGLLLIRNAIKSGKK